MSKNLRGLSSRKGLTDSLFRATIKAASSAEGDKDSLLKEISGKYLIGTASILSASSFYDFPEISHSGKKVYICDGTACLTSGNHEKLKKVLKNKYSENEIGSITCLGHCHSGTALMADREIYYIDDHDNTGLKIKPGSKPGSAFFTGTNAEKPVLIAENPDFEKYYSVLERYVQDIKSAFREIEISEIRGRGGAGFPLHIKLKASSESVSDMKYVVGNADEGDPGAFSDKWLLENRPHSVLFGMVATGLITGAETGVIYVRGEYPEAAKAIKTAIKQFEDQKSFLTRLLGKKFSFSFYVMEGAGAYICGEETSLLNSIEGLRPEVRSRPPFPATYGLFGKPTVLCNVETFANIWYILRKGGNEFSSLGTEKSKGTKLVSLDSGFCNPGLFEVIMGTPLKVIINEMGGGTRYPVKAFQVGGPLGGIVPSSLVNEMSLDFESFSDSGFLLGHAGVVSIPEDFSMMKLLLHLFDFVSKESCGKCFPCRIGSQRGFDLLNNAAGLGRKIDKHLFDDLLETMQLGSLCALGGGISLPVINIMKYFSAELEKYFK